MSKKIGITIEYGSSEYNFEKIPEDATVGTLRKDYICNFGIPKDTKAVIDGKEVADSTVLTANDTITFRKVTGRKG